MSHFRYLKKKYSLEDVLPFVDCRLNEEKKREREEKGLIKWLSAQKDYDGLSVRMDTLTLQIFARKGIQCSKCGIRGSFFQLARNKNSKDNNGKYSFCLFAVDEEGKKILMTKDHIVPLSKGGKKLSFDNCQPMCQRCNWTKGNCEDGNSG